MMHWLDPLRVTSWSNRIKLTVGFAAALVLPTLLYVAAVQPGLRAIGLQSLQSYIGESGERQQDAISNALFQARDTLDSFLLSDSYRRRVMNALLRKSPLLIRAPERAVTAEQLVELFHSTLLNRSTTLFDSIRLLDWEGRLVAEANLDGARLELESDQSASAAYRAALQAQARALELDQLLTVSTRSGEPVVEITNVLYWRDGRPFGYLVARVNTQRALYDNLGFHDRQYPAYSFLLTDDGGLIAPDETRAQAEMSLGSLAARRVLSGETGLDVYVHTTTNTEVIGYFAPIPNAPLALVAEIPTDLAIAQAERYFDAPLLIMSIIALAWIAALVVLFNYWLTNPLHRLRRASESIAQGDFAQPLPDVRRGDEIGALSVAFAQMRDQVQHRIHDLQGRLAARSQDVRVMQEISRYTTQQRDLPSLMAWLVGFVTEQFPGVDHAQIFLLDAERRYAALRASTSDVGHTRIAEGYRVPVGSASVVGQVTEQGRAILVHENSESPVLRRKELLPNSRAELVTPLRFGDEILGVLDVQSAQNDRFDPEVIAVFQSIAHQIVIAIQNARLYEESLRQFGEMEHRNRTTTRRVWNHYMQDRRARVLETEAGRRAADFSSLREQALATGQIAVGAPTQRSTLLVAAPIEIRGQTLGVVEWELPVEEVDANRLQLAHELVHRLAISLDNARLFEESERATERERVVNSIAAELTAQTEIDAILQTAVREVGQALHAPDVTIRLHRDDASR